MAHQTSRTLRTLILGAALLLPACTKAEAPTEPTPEKPPGCVAIEKLLIEAAAAEARFEVRAQEVLKSNPLGITEVLTVAIDEHTQLLAQLQAIQVEEQPLKGLLSDAADSSYIAIKMMESARKNFNKDHYESLGQQIELLEEHQKKDEALDARLKAHCSL